MEYKQVSSPTSYSKSGQVSKQKKSNGELKAVTHGMYEVANISKIPASERTPMVNQYAKMPKDRRKQGKGDERKEMRTDTYMFGAYLRSR